MRPRLLPAVVDDFFLSMSSRGTVPRQIGTQHVRMRISPPRSPTKYTFPDSSWARLHVDKMSFGQRFGHRDFWPFPSTPIAIVQRTIIVPRSCAPFRGIITIRDEGMGVTRKRHTVESRIWLNSLKSTYLPRTSSGTLTSLHFLKEH